MTDSASPQQADPLAELPPPFGQGPWQFEASQPELASAIRIQARRYCPEIQIRIDRDGQQCQVEFTDELAHFAGEGDFHFGDYRLARLTLADGAKSNVVYGIYAPGDFQPLDLDRADDLGLPAGKQGWTLPKPAAAPPGAITFIRPRTAMPVDQWSLVLAPEDASSPPWCKRLLEWSDVPHEHLVIRYAELSFYNGYNLVEVLTRKEPQPYKRSYALVRTDPANDQADVCPLNGASPVLHVLNRLPGVLLFDSPQRIDDYLRFFCWAVHGDGGPFYLPGSKRLRELEFSKPLTTEQLQALTTLEFGVRSAAANDAEAFKNHPKEKFARRIAEIAYTSAVFKARFAIDLASGTVEMVDDQPLVVDLPLLSERYGQRDLRVLRPIAASRPVPAQPPLPPPPRHYRQQVAGVPNQPAGDAPVQRPYERFQKHDRQPALDATRFLRDYLNGQRAMEPGEAIEVEGMVTLDNRSPVDPRQHDGNNHA